MPTMCRGFSYLEILISFFILSSSVLASSMLIARLQLQQIHLNQVLKAEFMADYIVNQLAISARHCQMSSDQPKASNRSSYLCVSKRTSTGGAFTAQSTVFDISNPLLEGYGSQDTNATDSHNPLGCIDYNSVSNAYMVGVFIHSMGRQQLAKTGCRELLNGLHVVVRYIALSSLSRSTP